MGKLKHLGLLLIVVGIMLAGWALWKHLHKSVIVNSYQTCIAEGNPVQESYPQVCVTRDGKRFTTPGAQSIQPPSEGLPQ